MKIYTNELGHMTNMSIYGKNFKKSSSPEPMTLKLSTYVALSMQDLSRLFKL